MTFEELKSAVEKLSPNLSDEGKMLVALFMPFCEAQQARIKELEDQLAKNSRNSSKPPSQDPYSGAKKNRKSKQSGRGVGGQLAHKGHKAKLKENPDHTIRYQLNQCPDCAHDLRSTALDNLLRKQVEDLPPLRSVITEHQIEIKTCPCCGQQWQAGGCDQQHEYEYGPQIKALAVYLSTHQFIPQARIKELLKLFGVELSTGTLNNFRRKGAKELVDFEDLLQQQIIQAKAAHFDETGMKVDGKNHWVHVASTQLYSWFGIHPRRGRVAHEAFGILPEFKGVAHRDSYRSYDDYPQSRDSLCNAHIIRELEFAIERDEQAFWAKPMLDLLLTIKKQVEARTDQVADLRWQGRHCRNYQRLVDLGLAQNPAVLRPDGQLRGPTKQSKTYNLLIRLRDRQDDVLRFMTEPLAEFTNNQAERDLRMNKVRAKISGGFRAITPAKEFMRLRSLIHTAIKQTTCPRNTLVQLFTPGCYDFLSLVNPD